MEYYIKVDTDTVIYVNDINPTGQKAILFIHGWPLSHKAYEYQFTQLPRLGYRCIGMDLRGFGMSGKPWHGYNYDRMSDDIRGVVDAMCLSDFTLAGHSMGGAISIRYMARHNGYGVKKLALFGAAAPSFTSRPDFPHGMSPEDVTRLIRQSYADRPKLLRDFGDMFFFQYITPALSDWFFQLGLQAAGWSTAACLAALRDESLFADLGKIAVPTLILHGIHDKVCPYALALAQKQGIRDARLVPFEYSGHATFYEQRDRFNTELAQFAG